MSCSRCLATNGKAHSFEKIGILQDNSTNLFYTCPANALEQDDSPEALQYYLAHFESTRPNPWIWIFNCRGVNSKDLIKSGLGRRLADSVQQNCFDTLRGIYIINPTTTIRALILFLYPFLKKDIKSKIHICSLGPIDAINKLQSLGINTQDINTLTRKITTV